VQEAAKKSAEALAAEPKAKKRSKKARKVSAKPKEKLKGDEIRHRTTTEQSKSEVAEKAAREAAKKRF